MANEPRIIQVDEGSELARVLEEADKTPLRLTKGSVSYWLIREALRDEAADSLTSHKPPTPEEAAASRDGIREAAGAWKDVDAEAFKRYIAERRRSSSRPPVRL